MDSAPFAQIVLLVVWLAAVLDVILALYVLLLNAWHTANRHVSAMFLVYAMNMAAVALTLGATEASEVTWQTYVLASTSPIVQTLVSVASLVLLKPGWLGDRWRRLRWLLYGLMMVPALLTLIDTVSGTGLWYTGLDPAAYSGGYPPLEAYTAAGVLTPYVRILYFYVISLAPFLIAAHTILFDDRAAPAMRRLAWVLVGAQTLGLIIQMGLMNVLSTPLRSALLTLTLVVAYTYAAFQHMISERRAQRGRLTFRLAAIILAIAVPLLASAALFTYLQVEQQIIEDAQQRLRDANWAMASNISVWLDMNVETLRQLATLPDITSMDPRRQEPVLQTTAAMHPHMYLVSTTDLTGMNVARSDAVEPKDYSDRPWFQEVRDGSSLTFESMIWRTSGEPALVASVPIQNSSGTTVGACMFASDLNVVSDEVQAIEIGETSLSYVVDAGNLVIAHPDPSFSAELRDLSSYPPVSALREAGSGSVSFTDEDGIRWRAQVEELERGWGVIVQQQEAEFTAGLRQLQVFSLIGIVGSTILLGGLTSLAIRQALRPIGALTETATAIARGDLTRIAPVEGMDEIGVLASTFNSMTAQLNEQIGTLEQRVASRTRDLERRTRYLEASARIARETTMVLEPQQMLDQLVGLISEYFGFYHTGIFLLDETREWAVLLAASSEGGRRMLARDHRLAVGEVGIVGYVTGRGEPRVALDVDQDAIYYDNPDMPETRSEIALPLRVRGEVIGALDVQSKEPMAFSEEDIDVLQTLADQVAIAISNARLVQQVQASLEAERRAYGEISREAWQRTVRTPAGLAFRADEHGVSPVGDGQGSEPDLELPEVRLPIEIRGQVIGTIRARKATPNDKWTDGEMALIETLTSQLEQALDSARLYRDSQATAERERLVGEVTARIRERLEMEAMLKTAAQQIRQALNLPELTIRLASGGSTEGNGRE